MPSSDFIHSLQLLSGRLPTVAPVPRRNPSVWLLPPCSIPRTPTCSCSITAAGTSPADTDPLDGLPPLRTLFRGGFKQLEIKVPSLVRRVGAEEVLRMDESGATLGAAVSKGVGIVVLDVAEQSGGLAYEAACALKSLLGERAYLLIAERVDVAAAIGASGVVLSDKGIPAIVAGNMMSKSKSDTVFLPLVARALYNAISVEHAASSDGADFLMINIGSETI